MSVNGKYFTSYGIGVYEHYYDVPGSRNRFYGVFRPSEVEVVFNDLPGSVKSFKTVNYEGTQSRVTKHTNVNNATDAVTFTDAAGNIITDLTDGNYYNLEEKEGWYVDSFETDMQVGQIPEFIQKENKWFNKIIGGVGVASEGDFSVQGLGFPLDVSTAEPEPTEAPIVIEADLMALSTSTGILPGMSYIPLYTQVTGGVPPYAYEWSTEDGNIAGSPTPTTTQVFSDGPGTYTVLVTDSAGNGIYGTYEIE